MNIFNALSEELKRPFYSHEEAKEQQQKSLSTSSQESDYESDYIPYDPFNSYYNTSLQEQSGSGINRKEIIAKWRKCAWNAEVDEAITEILSEAIVYDEQDPPVKVDLDNVDISKKIKEKIIKSFENILFMLDFNRMGEDLFKKWYIDGQLNLEVVYDNNKLTDGIQKLIVLAPYNIWKIRNEKTAEIKYIIKDGKPEASFAQNIKKAERIFEPEQLTQIVSGLWSNDNKTPMSYLQKVVKPVNQLSLLEDAVVIWHITRSPEKRVFYIDTGNLPKSKAEEYIKRLIAKYRQKKIYDVNSGTIDNRSNTISILEDFWLPRNAAGRGTEIDTLAASSEGMENMTHIEYFVNKIYKALNVPRSRRDEENRIAINSSLDIEKDELKFWKFILKLRRRFNNLFIDLLKKDLLAKKILNLQDWEQIQEKINFIYVNNNPYSDIKKLQILEMRMGIAENALNLVESDLLSKQYVKEEIMAQTKEEIEKIKKEREEEKKEGDGEVAGGDEMGGDYYQSAANDGTGATPPGQPTPQQGIEKENKPVYLAADMKEELSNFIRQQVQEAILGLRRIEAEKKKADFVNNLKEGDIISNGTDQLILRNGKLVPYTEK